MKLKIYNNSKVLKSNNTAGLFELPKTIIEKGNILEILLDSKRLILKL